MRSGKSYKSIVFLSLCWIWTTLAVAAGPQLKGRLLNGREMTRQVGIRQLVDDGLPSGTQPVPLAEKQFHIQLAGDPQRSWQGTTDSEGRFTVELSGLQGLPRGPTLVARAQDGDSTLYSLALAPLPEGETEFRLYGLTDNASILFDTRLEALYTFTTGGQNANSTLLDVRVTFVTSNFSSDGDLYVGQPLVGSPGRRAVFRLPLPAGAKVTRNRGHRRHDLQPSDAWTITRDGWAIIDAPVPPASEAPSGVSYELRYVAPAYQEMIHAYPVDVPLDAMVIRGIHEKIAFTAPRLPGARQQTLPDPEDPSGVPITWDTHFGQVQAGEEVGLGLTIDSLALNQVNRGSLQVVGGMVLGTLVAILLGLILGRRGPRVEVVLSEASGEEIIERIAQLDAQHEKKLVPEKEYRDTRERLLALARYEVPELAPKKGKQAGGGLSPKVVTLVRRIRELGKEASGDPRKIQERLLLLEDLAKAVDDDSKDGDGKATASVEKTPEAGA